MAIDVQRGPFRPGLFRSPRVQQLAELAVFLFLIVPGLILSFLIKPQAGTGFTLTAVMVMARDLALVALIFYFLRRNAEPPQRVGWGSRPWPKELAIGLVLAVPFWVAAVLLEAGFRAAGLSSPSHMPSDLTPAGLPQVVLGTLLVSVVAVSEETIFRGYLILRLRNLGASRTVAALASAFVFALGHGYEGSAGVLTVGVMGVGLAAVYLWRRSLVAPMVMHFVFDFVGIVLVWLPAVSRLLP